jgi:hypothetical protein
VYEGQLSDPVHALPKFEAAADRGLNVENLVIHISSAQALTNTILRFEREGRGATIEALARIQGYLPSGLQRIYDRFGDKIGFSVVDKRDMLRVVRLRGWEAVTLLESEGIMSTSNKSLPTSSKPTNTVPVSSPPEPTSKPAVKPLPPSIDLFIKTAIARFNDRTTPFPKVW